MTWYAVSYDLRKEYSSEAWERIGEALRTAFDWCTPLYSFWVIETGLAPSGVINTLLHLGAIDDNDGIDPVYGAGAQLNFHPLLLRAEYERYDFDSDYEMDSFTASVGWQF